MVKTTLHLEDIPAELHDRIRRLAQCRNRTMDSEVVDLLMSAVSQAELQVDRADVLANLGQNRFHPPADAPDSIELLREDRDR